MPKVIVSLPDNWDYNPESLHNAVKAALLEQQALKLTLMDGELANKEGLDPHAIATALLLVDEDATIWTDEGKIRRFDSFNNATVTLSCLH